MNRARTLRKRAGACALSFILAATLFPAAAFADDPPDVTDDDSKNWNNQTRYNVTAPVALIFGSEGNGYDVNDTSGSVTATGTFKNYADPVRLSAVDYMSYDDDTSSKKAFSSLDGTSVDVIDTFGSKKSVNVPLNKHVTTEATSESYIDGFIINGSSTASATNPSKTDMQFKLNFKQDVNSNNVNVNKAAADAGETAYPFGKIRYTFDTKIADFFLIDIRDGRYDIYDLPTVKQHALNIAKGVTTSVSDQRTESAEAMYTAFATYPAVKNASNQIVSRDGKQNYICKVYLGSPYNDYYNLKIIGVNQDKLTAEIDGRTTAGITFMFSESIGPMRYSNWIFNADQGVDGEGWNNGWEDSLLYKAMNKIPGYAPGEGDPTSASFEPIYEALKDADAAKDIKEVNKHSGVSRHIDGCVDVYYNGTRYSMGTVLDSANKLFIPSFTEISGANAHESNFVDANHDYEVDDPADVEEYFLLGDGLSNTPDYYERNFPGQYMYFESCGVHASWLVTNRRSDNDNLVSAGKKILLNNSLYMKDHSSQTNMTWWTRTQNPSWNHWQLFILNPPFSTPYQNIEVMSWTQECVIAFGVVPCFCL